jgi:hypothetical protein
VVSGISVPSFRRTFDGRSCRRKLRRVLPGLGLYRVEVTVHTALGASVTLSRIVRVRDYLIVSIGDSLQSGEGVPDERGRYFPPVTMRIGPFAGKTAAVTARPAAARR